MPLASRIRVRPTRRRAWSSARTARSPVTGRRARHLQGHDGRPARRAGDAHCAVEGREPPGDTRQPRRRPGRRRRGRRRRRRAAAACRRACADTQARPAPECLTMLARHSATAKYAADSTGAGSVAGHVQRERDRQRDRQRQRLDARRPARGRRAPADGCRGPPTRRSSSAEIVVSRASRSSSAAALGVGGRSASRRGRRSCRPRRSGPGRRRAGRARSGVPRRRSGRASRCGTRRPPRPGARAARPGSGRGCCARRAPGRAPVRASRTTRRRAAARRAAPAATTRRRRRRWRRRGGRTGAISSATGSTDITNPPVAENHRNADVAPARLVAQPAHRPGDEVACPSVSAYPAVIRSPSRAPLTRRCTAVSAAVAGTTASARAKPTTTSPSGTQRIDRIASASAGMPSQRVARRRPR